MPITEVLSGAGSWNLKLRDDTPGQILDSLSQRFKNGRWATTIVTSARIDHAHLLPESQLLGAALWSGILLGNPDPYSLSGVGNGGWLGIDSMGPRDSWVLPFTGNDFATWLYLWVWEFPAAGTLGGSWPYLAWNVGNVQNSWPSLAMSGNGFDDVITKTRRQLVDWFIDWWALQWGGHFRLYWEVRPDRMFRCGEAFWLWGTSPAIALTEQVEGRVMTGPDQPALIGARITPSVNMAETATGAMIRGVHPGSGGPYYAYDRSIVGALQPSPAPVVKMWNGTRYVEHTTYKDLGTTQPQPTHQNSAVAEYHKYPIRRSYSVEVDYPVAPHLCRPGHAVWLDILGRHWHSDLVESVSQLQGATVFPLKPPVASYLPYRVVETTWGVERGMGVYVSRTNAGTPDIIDISDWIENDSSPCRLTVGNPAERVDNAILGLPTLG